MKRLFILLTLALSAAAFAEDPVIEEIIVYGEFRDTAVTDVGASVTVLSVADQADPVEHLEEVIGRIPNVNFSSGASRARFLQIRGIGERGQFSEPLNSSVGLLVDGVDLSGIGTVATLHDVAQVEVFRGPQGTLYGANALAGLINVLTNAPAEVWGGEVTLGLADYNARTVGAVVSGPLSDRLGLRISAHQHTDDGFIENTFLGDDDTNDRDERTVRAKLNYTGDLVSWQLNAATIDVDNGYDAFSLDNDRRTRSDQPGQDTQETDYASLFLSVPLTDALLVEGSVGLATSDIEYGYDEDWTFTGFHPFGYSSTDFYGRERDTATFDARLVSTGDGPISWVAGVYALNQEVEFRRIYTFAAADFFSDFEVDRRAIYGELEYAVGDFGRLKVGLRGEQHESEYRDSNGVRFSPDDDMLGGRIVYEHDLASGNMVYVGANRGYKAGGFNTDGTLDADLRLFDPEVLWNFEVGLKARYLDDRLGIAASVFYMLRDDVQISTSVVRVRPDNSAEFIAYTGNAAEGFNRGVEIEADLQVNDVLRLYGSFGWLDTEYEDFVNGAGVSLDGREQAHAPGYQFFLGAEFLFDYGLFARIEFEGRDEFFFSDTHGVKSDAYELLHASFGYEGDRFEAVVWGRNITNEDYFVRGFFFGNDPRDLYTARGFTQLGEPARYGVTAKVRF